MVCDILYENLNFLYENLNFLYENLRFSLWKISMSFSMIFLTIHKISYYKVRFSTGSAGSTHNFLKLWIRPVAPQFFSRFGIQPAELNIFKNLCSAGWTQILKILEFSRLSSNLFFPPNFGRIFLHFLLLVQPAELNFLSSSAFPARARLYPR